jgi:hypothetical protein
VKVKAAKRRLRPAIPVIRRRKVFDR